VRKRSFPEVCAAMSASEGPTRYILYCISNFPQSPGLYSALFQSQLPFPSLSCIQSLWLCLSFSQ
jgi:hypothetical protein